MNDKFNIQLKKIMNFTNKNKIIECYQIIETIGKGANGLVYKGINLNNGMFVAMK